MVFDRPFLKLSPFEKRTRDPTRFVENSSRYGVEIRLFSGRRGAAPYDLTYIIRRPSAENRLPSPVGEGGPSETVDEESLAQMIFVFFRFAVAVRKIHCFRALREAPLRAKIETASDCPLNEGRSLYPCRGESRIARFLNYHLLKKRTRLPAIVARLYERNLKNCRVVRRTKKFPIPL